MMAPCYLLRVRSGGIYKSASITGKFMVVDITNDQLPLLVRDWLLKLRLNCPKLLGYNSVNKVDSMTLKNEFPDVFQAVIDLKEGSKPRLCKSCPIPFELHKQVEQTIHK